MRVYVLKETMNSVNSHCIGLPFEGKHNGISIKSTSPLPTSNTYWPPQNCEELL